MTYFQSCCPCGQLQKPDWVTILPNSLLWSLKASCLGCVLLYITRVSSMGVAKQIQIELGLDENAWMKYKHIAQNTWKWQTPISMHTCSLRVWASPSKLILNDNSINYQYLRDFQVACMALNWNRGNQTGVETAYAIQSPYMSFTSSDLWVMHDHWSLLVCSGSIPARVLLNVESNSRMTSILCELVPIYRVILVDLLVTV